MWNFLSNAEFISTTANFVHVLLFIYLIYLLTSVTRGAFIFLVQIGVVLYAIHAVYVFNKDTTMSRVYNKTVVDHVQKIEIEKTAEGLGESIWSAMGSIGRRLNVFQ